MTRRTALVSSALVLALLTAASPLRAQDMPLDPEEGDMWERPPEMDGTAVAGTAGVPWYEQGGEAGSAVREHGDAEDVEPGDEPEDAPAAAGAEESGYPRFSPFATIVGGFHYQDIRNRDETDERQDRFTTVALTRFGFQAFVHENVSIVSELELNSGPHGTSVWEGQAAIQVRNQLLRIDYEGLRIDAGRVTDPTSLDYFTPYIANMLLTDSLSRFPLLVSGFNRGNGVLASYEVLDGLRLAVTVNAGNPTSTTGTVMIGGTFPPFSRFYQVPQAHVGRDARGFPADSFHVVLASPSVSYQSEWLSAQASLQWFTADINTNDRDNPPLRGTNLRGGAALHLLDQRLRPFANFSRVLNDVTDPTDSTALLNEKYEARTFTGGMDFVIDPETGTGLGAQYSRVRERQGAGVVIIRHYMNVGASWWFVPGLALDARVGFYARCDDGDCSSDGELSSWLTLRAVLGGVQETAGRNP